MYKSGLMRGERKKSSNVVGATMQFHPHGDSSIYDTLVRLTRGNAALLHPFIDSKGSFGKQYSRDMAPAAPRYTEVKLEPFCETIFDGLDRDAVDMVPNFDNTDVEPILLPTKYPNVLVSPNMGIAVGMASQICSFNLAEVCDGAVEMLRHPNFTPEKMLDVIKAPDFSGGASLIYDRDRLLEIYKTGRGSVTLRARWHYDKKNNCIEILEIPYSTSIEAILQKIGQLVKDGKLKEITDFRDEIDLSGFKLALDLRRGVDPDAVMAKLFKLTPLQDDFSCNFNVIIDSVPRQLGICEILSEWIRFRMTCVRRELTFDLHKKEERLHLLKGLGKILLDIDKAIRIIRETKLEAEVVPNLMAGFRIDEKQAEYVAEIKLRHINREYIVNRIRDIESLTKEIEDLKAILGDELKIKGVIVEELRDIKKKYGQPRRTMLISADEIEDIVIEDTVENYNCRVVMTKEGYFKKITDKSLRMADDQKLKEGDEIADSFDVDNTAELIVFTDRAQCYKAKVADFDTTKASAMGDYLPVKLGMDEGERPIMMYPYSQKKAKDNVIFIFENGKGVRVPADSYETKSNRRRLTGAYSDASPIVCALWERESVDLLLMTSDDRGILISSKLIPQKTTRSAGGVTLVSLKKKQTLSAVYEGEKIEKFDVSKVRKVKIPATPGPVGTQLTLEI
jgi:DNA gyrase subunit A